MTTQVAPLCHFCRYFDGGWRAEKTCAAFPEGIPAELYCVEGDHRVPHPGDHGIQFEPAPGFEGVDLGVPASSDTYGLSETDVFTRRLTELAERLQRRPQKTKRTTRFIFDERGAITGKETIEEAIDEPIKEDD